MQALLNYQPPDMSSDLPMIPPFNVDFLQNYGHQNLFIRAHVAAQFLVGPTFLEILNYHPIYFKSEQSKIWRSQVNEDMFFGEISYGLTEAK